MTVEDLLECKIIGIIRGVSSKDIVRTVEALVKGGIKAVEITFDQKDKEKYEDTKISLKLLSETFGDKISLGAGTVMTEECVREALESGAKYIISPNVDEKVIRETKRLGGISIPGALTPTEAAIAYNVGADIVKLFPAGSLGIGYIKGLLGPLNHIPFMAVGGVSPDNINEFFEIGVSGVGIGGNLVPLNLISQGKFQEITEIAKSYVEKIK